METATRAPVARRPFRFDVEAYHRMGKAGVFQGRKVELVHGEIIEMSPMGVPHANVVSYLTEYLVQHAPSIVQVRCQIPIPLSSGSEPEPDISLVARPTRRSEAAVDIRLAIEVSDSTLDYDLGDKARLYAESGVPEYWVLDINSKVTTVHRAPLDGTYSSAHQVRWGDPLTAFAVPGLTVTLSSVLED